MKEKQLVFNFDEQETNNDYDYNFDLNGYNTEWFNIMLSDQRFRIIKSEERAAIHIQLNFSYYTKGKGNVLSDIQCFLTNAKEKMIFPHNEYLQKVNIWADYRDHNIEFDLTFPMNEISDMNDLLRFSISFIDERKNTYIRKSYILHNKEWIEDEIIAFKRN